MAHLTPARRLLILLGISRPMEAWPGTLPVPEAAQTGRLIIRSLREPELSTRGGLVLLSVLPIGFLLVFGLDWFLTGVGIPPTARPDWARVLLIVPVVVAPFAIIAFVLAGRWLKELPALSWIFVSPQPMAAASELGLELHIPRRGIGFFAWSEIDRLERARLHGDLIGSDGRLLVRLPRNLLDFKPQVLEDAVVVMRPDRYILLESRYLNYPLGFRRRRADEPVSLTVEQGGPDQP